MDIDVSCSCWRVIFLMICLFSHLLFFLCNLFISVANWIKWFIFSHDSFMFMCNFRHISSFLSLCFFYNNPFIVAPTLICSVYIFSLYYFFHTDVIVIYFVWFLYLFMPRILFQQKRKHQQFWHIIMWYYLMLQLLLNILMSPLLSHFTSDVIFVHKLFIYTIHLFSDSLPFFSRLIVLITCFHNIFTSSVSM